LGDGARPIGQIAELPADRGFERRGVGCRVERDLGKQVTRVGVEVVGQRDVRRGGGTDVDGVFIPAQLRDRAPGGRRFRLVLAFTLEAHQRPGESIRWGAGRQGHRQGTRSRLAGDAGVNSQAGSIHYNVIANVRVDVGRANHHEDGGPGQGVVLQCSVRADGHPIGHHRIAGGRGCIGDGEHRTDQDWTILADGPRQLCVHVFLDQPGVGDGGVDLLVLVHHLHAHHEDRGHGRHDQHADRHRHQDLHEGEGPGISPGAVGHRK
jgi:hypothetical protein